MPLEGLTQAAIIKIDGTEVSADVYASLSEVRVELSFGAAGWFQLRISSEDELDSSFAIGKTITIDFDDADGAAVRVFAGTIDSMAIDHDQSRRQLLVSGYDARRKLGSAPRVHAYTDQTYANILSSIASDCGLTSEIDVSSPTFPHVMQVGSNTQFVAEIARRLGLEWFVDGDKLVVRPRTAGDTIELALGEQLRRFSARYTAAEHPATVEAHGWNPESKQAIVSNETSAQTSPLSNVPIESSSRSAAANGRTATSWARPLLSVNDGDTVAKGLARRMASGDLTGRGEIDGNPSVVPGVLCDISGIDDNWNGEYYVTSAEHVYRYGEPYLTRFTVGGLDSSSLVDLMGTTAPRVGGGFGTGLGAGVTIGVVTNNKNDTTDHGHVKVKFPYLDSQVESAWARVATIGAGDKRGIMFMPEVNDEVLVAFEHGDVSRPYVIGTLWNGEDRPPLTRDDDDPNKRVIASRLGHTLTFFDGDSDAKKNVTIVLADKKTTLHLGHDKIEIIANDGKPIEVKNDKAKVVFTGGGDLQLEAENITIKAKKNLKLEGQKIETSSQTDTKISATAKLELKSNAPAKVESSAILELKGAMVKVN